MHHETVYRGSDGNAIMYSIGTRPSTGVVTENVRKPDACFECPNRESTLYGSKHEEHDRGETFNVFQTFPRAPHLGLFAVCILHDNTHGHLNIPEKSTP